MGRPPLPGPRRERAEREPGPRREDPLLSAGRPHDALVLRRYDYSETSQILRLLTGDAGVLSVLAKGSKKEKSSFGGPLDLFYRGTALVVFRRTGLHILAGFTVDDAQVALRAELPRVYAASHLAEILTGLTREEEPSPGLFEATTAGLAALGRAAPEEVPAVLAAAELEILGRLGFAPALDACAACGREAPGPGGAFSPALGGAVCTACRHRDPASRPLTGSAAAALGALARTAPDRAGRIRLSPADRRAIRAFLTGFVEWRLERALRTARFL